MPYLENVTNHHSSQHAPCATPDAFHRLVQDLSDVLGPSSGIDSADVDPQDLIDLMKRYESKEAEWAQYAFSDFKRNYTRNLVDEGNGKSNLLVLVWNPGKGSLIHDHANAHCVMKILKGSLKETLYAWPHSRTASIDSSASAETLDSVGSIGSCDDTAGLVQTRSTVYGVNEVTYIADDIGLHKIENPSLDEAAISLHLYTPPHAANHGFHLFDESTGKQTHMKQADFFSNRGRKIKPGLSGLQ